MATTVGPAASVPWGKRPTMTAVMAAIIKQEHGHISSQNAVPFAFAKLEVAAKNEFRLIISQNGTDLIDPPPFRNTVQCTEHVLS
jgi:hypothetical protein